MDTNDNDTTNERPQPQNKIAESVKSFENRNGLLGTFEEEWEIYERPEVKKKDNA